jgi:hypothetical protein
MAKNYKDIAKFLENVRFRYKFIGGVDEEDVWRVFEQMHNEYDELLEVEHQSSLGAVGEWRDYALQLQEMMRVNDEEVKRLRAEWNQLKDVMKKDAVRPAEKYSRAMPQQTYAPEPKRQTAYPQRGGCAPRTIPTVTTFSAGQLLAMYGGRSAANE